jgi:hypothetical protein
MSPFENKPTPLWYPLVLDLITLLYLNLSSNKLHVRFHQWREVLHGRTPCSKWHSLREYSVILKCGAAAERRPSSVAVLQLMSSVLRLTLPCGSRKSDYCKVGGLVKCLYSHERVSRPARHCTRITYASFTVEWMLISEPQKEAPESAVRHQLYVSNKWTTSR